MTISTTELRPICGLKRSGIRLSWMGDSSEYFCSIVRFTIQTGNTLPVLLPRVAIQNEMAPPLFQPNSALNQLAQKHDNIFSFFGVTLQLC